ncbi:MAG: dTDP-glucose 4,6-dehydratase [Deltaproteobacteria bacterium]|nr:dTDP-glucose 4,6-dehydratase [Deltaproteobacteria bacterium]
MRSVLVTGGCGFIGSNFIRLLLAEEPEAELTNLDLLTYAGNPKNLEDLEGSSRYRFVHGDVRDETLVEELVREVDWIVNFAAETHVDRSTPAQAGEFVETNVQGPYVLADALRRAQRDARLLQVGTDEVYGSLSAPRRAREDALLEPSSPYSASKAGGDLVALGFHRMLGMDVLVSRCTNNYGPYQYPEKLLPLFITNAMQDEPLPLYDGGTQIRDWLWVDDHCRALLLLLREGEAGEIYNVGANQDPEITNGELTRMLLRLLGKPESLIRPVEGLRPGHDQRYAVDSSKLRALGWAPSIELEEGVQRTLDWYQKRRDWWEPIKSGAYREYYRRHYGLEPKG